MKNLLAILEQDPIAGNIALRKLFPDGIKCTPRGHSDKKNLNQNNSSWELEGVMVVDGWKEGVKL
ncbi:MAG: hypothetical protein WCG27_00125 [Pseudomonadota bacterium]